MAKKGLIAKTLLGVIEAAVRSRADQLYMLSGGRPGSQKRKPNITTYYETGLVVAIFEHLLMSPKLAHLEICHERAYRATTRPEQVDIWIKPVNGGTETLIECGDFSPGKIKADAYKMRRLNPKGVNWFLAFFREQDDASENPWGKIKGCRGRRGSLKGCHLGLEEKFAGSFKVQLPDETFTFATL